MTTVSVPVPSQTVPVPAITPPPLQVSITAAGESTVSGTLSVPEVTPPALVVPASTVQYSIQVSDAVATLQAAGYTVTAPSTAPTPAPTPSPAPTSSWGGVIVDAHGNLDPYWGGSPTPAGVLYPGGNWDVNCTSTPAQVAPDGGTALSVSPSGEYAIFLPYPAGIAGQPQNNGIAANLSGFTEVTVDICPVKAGMSLGTQLYSVSGKYVAPYASVNDAGLGEETIATNLPAGVFTTVTCPLSKLGIPSSNTLAPNWTYKISLQNQSGVETQFFVRNFKFV